MKYSKLNLFIRALLFSIYSPIAIFFYSFTVLFSFVFPLRIRYVFIRSFLRTHLFVLEKICLIKYEVEGLDNIPKDRNGIIMSKHQSTWETFYLPIIFKDTAILAKRELLWIPFFGWSFALSQPITIDRSKKSSSMQQIIKQGTERLKEGRWILIFPEGTRVPAGVVGNYKLGGARLAAATGAPIIPVAHNAGRYWPRRSFIKRPGTIRVVIGPLIETKDRTPDDIMTETKNWIESTIKRIDTEN